MHGLIDSVPFKAVPYAEYAWVCAPNAAGQSITANTITTLTMDTEVADFGVGGSIGSNQVTLPAGTYYFEAEAPFRTASAYSGYILTLRNVSDSTNLKSGFDGDDGGYCGMPKINGQFTITSSKIFDLRCLSTVAAECKSGTYTTYFTDSTAGADQRTTLKLWKVA